MFSGIDSMNHTTPINPNNLSKTHMLTAILVD